MKDVFLSRWAWVLIPVLTSVMCSVGLAASLRIVRITHREIAVHREDFLTPAAKYLHVNAHFRIWVHALILTAGVLVTVPTVVIPTSAPPTQGWWLFFWLNHYVVGLTALYLVTVSLRAYYVRSRAPHV